MINGKLNLNCHELIQINHLKYQAHIYSTHINNVFDLIDIVKIKYGIVSVFP